MLPQKSWKRVLFPGRDWRGELDGSFTNCWNLHPQSPRGELAVIFGEKLGVEAIFHHLLPYYWWYIPLMCTFSGCRPAPHMIHIKIVAALVDLQ